MVERICVWELFTVPTQSCWSIQYMLQTYISEGFVCHFVFELLITDAGTVFLLFCTV